MILPVYYLTNTVNMDTMQYFRNTVHVSMFSAKWPIYVLEHRAKRGRIETGVVVVLKLLYCKMINWYDYVAYTQLTWQVFELNQFTVNGIALRNDAALKRVHRCELCGWTSFVILTRIYVEPSPMLNSADMRQAWHFTSNNSLAVSTIRKWTGWTEMRSSASWVIFYC